MKRRLSIALYFAALATLSIVSVYRWRHALPAASEHPFAVPAAPKTMVVAPDSVFDDLEATIVSNDAFRLASAPSSVRYDPLADARPGVPPLGSPAIRPTLTLKAIVGGPPWQGIVDGIPGQPSGTVVRAGLSFDKLTVRSVTRDSIIIQGPDTMWVLSFRRRS